MYQLKITDWFSAGHQLKGYKGKCESVHGHNFKVEVAVAGKKLDKTGLLLDFKLLKSELAKVLDKLDHKMLNQVAPFNKINPSAENLAEYIFDKFSQKLPAGVELVEVWVWESERAGACFKP
jgi:6-pyruvoyltetrahydropterin/6-carboxytetrahydropterin synthase